MSEHSATATARVTAPVGRTFSRVTSIDPTRFYPRFRVLPAVVAVHDQTGGWTSVGETRRLELSDGGTVVETLHTVDSPRLFVYELSQFTGFFGRLVEGARAEWMFDADADGDETVVTWNYTFRARRGWGPAVAVIMRLAWVPYMRLVLPPIAATAED